MPDALLSPASATPALPKIDFVTYGEAMALFIADQVGELAHVDRFTKRVAGADLNVATGLARLGFKVGYISRVGQDSFGQLIRHMLQTEGIDASRVTVDPRYPTGFQLKGKTETGDPATEYFRRGSAASHLSEADFDLPYIDQAHHLHLTGVAPAISASSRQFALKLARHFRAAGKTISFDPNLRPTLWPSEAEMIAALNELAALATWVFPGLSEGLILTGHATPEAIADFYLAMGVRGVVVKLGEEGAFFASAEGQRGYVPAVPVSKVIDTVGAGDGFAVGVISGIADGLTLEQASARGALIGALAVQVIGDSEGLPTRAVLNELEAAGA
jgi:2-dehydro-3-deoxygluconokinase